MTSTKTWNFGDKVVHTGKPEWGRGVVSSAQKTQHEGHPCQMLTIRFDRAGIKTISTAFATLIAADDAPHLPEENSSGSTGYGGPAQSAAVAAGDAALSQGYSAADIRAAMTKLPEAATDPFTTPVARLRATLLLYRFTPTGASLLDWAAVQSGLADPMSRFNRHELEKFFESFVVTRDQHLRKVVLEARKADPAAAAQALAAAPAPVQQALRRFDTMR